MINEGKSNNESRDSAERFTVRLTDPMLYDRLHTLAIEYSISEEVLINVAVERLIKEVDFVRNLRIGKVETE